MLPIASFLAGALLSLLLPIGLLIAITIWHASVIRRVPEPTEGPEDKPAGATTAAPPTAPSAADPPVQPKD